MTFEASNGNEETGKRSWSKACKKDKNDGNDALEHDLWNE
jgi:hypothetical protein